MNDDAFRTAWSASASIYHMEERQRVKIVDYIGSSKVERDEGRREDEGGRASRSASTRSSTKALVRRVKGIVRDMMAEKGYEFAEVTPRRSSRCPAGRSWCT